MTDPQGAATVIHETPLASRHEAQGARMIDFAGWRMPVQYGSIIDEHRSVRERAGLFDLGRKIYSAEFTEQRRRRFFKRRAELREEREATQHAASGS